MFHPGNKIALQYVWWWVFCLVAQVFVLHRLGLSWQSSAADAAVFAVILGLACFVALTIFRYYQPGQAGNIYRFVFAIAISAVACAVFEWLMPAFVITEPPYAVFLTDSIPVRFVFVLLAISFVTVLNTMWRNQKEQKRQDVQRNENERLLREAELIRLRQQLQPHFLFNSLNSISALVTTDAVKTRTVIQQLSDFLRGTLKKDEESAVKLGDELSHLALYLEIEKVRFGNRLSIEVTCEEGCNDLRIPPLMLQPLVENAIKFGLYGTLGNITVTIRASRVAGMLCLAISNPFDADTSEAAGGTGFGLNSVHRRLFLLYSRNDLLQVKKEDGRYYASLMIPQEI